VLRRLENQIVAGDGTGQNLTGLIHSGIPDGTYTAGVPLAVLALSGIVDVLTAASRPCLSCFVLSASQAFQRLAGPRPSSHGVAPTCRGSAAQQILERARGNGPHLSGASPPRGLRPSSSASTPR
jgi:hypothetical protein